MLYDENGDEETYCYKCERSFGSGMALLNHLRDSSRHNWCQECEREFATPAALRGHQVTHMPKIHPCLRQGCGAKFATPSAALKHMERSSCGGRLSPAAQAKYVHDWENRTGNTNMFTKARIGWHGSDDTTGTSTYIAGEGTWNGRAYECYFCDKECRTLASLNQHLNSGVHEGKEFRCKHCGFDATWMSGLYEHYESEKCGYMRRGQVRMPFAQLTLGN